MQLSWTARELLRREIGSKLIGSVFLLLATGCEIPPGLLNGACSTPSAPSLTGKATGATAVNLNLGAPAGSNVAKYVLSRDGAPLATVTATNTGTTTYSDNSLKANTIYSYAAQAQNSCAQASATTTVRIATTPVNPDIGVNLEGLSDWSYSRMYTDLFRTARGWGSPNTPWDGAAAVDANGWPTGDAGVVLAASLGPTSIEPNATYLEAGTYKLSFQGQAVVTALLGSATLQNQSYNAKTGVTTADVVVPNAMSFLFLSFTGTNGGVKGATLYRPGYAGTGKLFTDPFLAALQPFSTLRFMDLLATNGNSVAHWADRNTSQTASYANGKGAPWEDIIALANLTLKDIWINIPVSADDDYVTNLAKLLQAKLDPNVHVYVEYSNEVWNTGFAQAFTNKNFAVSEAAAGDTSLTGGLACSASDLASGNNGCNEWWAAWLRVPKRTAQISGIFAQVFGKAAINSRIRPVLATQFAYRAIGEQQLKYLAKYQGDPRTLIYAVAGAPYYGIVDADAQSATLSLDQLMGDYLSSVNAYASDFKLGTAYNGADWTNATQLALAKYYGIKSFAYEGGNDYGQYNTNLAVKVQSNFDSRHTNILNTYYGQWFGCGNDLFMHFSLASGYGQWGSWGLTNNIGDLTLPKYAAVKALTQTPLASFSTCR